MAKQPRKRIFISQAHADADLGVAVKRLLQEGLNLAPSVVHTTVIPSNRPDPGAVIEQDIVGLLNSVDVVVLLMTNNYWARAWCFFEALKVPDSKIILPLVVPPTKRTDLPPFFASKAVYPIDEEESWDTIVEVIRRSMRVSFQHDYWKNAVRDFIQYWRRRPQVADGVIPAAARRRATDLRRASDWTKESSPSRCSVSHTTGLAIDQLLARLATCKKGLRIWTTWTPLLLRHDHPGGRYEDLLQSLEKLSAGSRKGGIEVEILLIHPRGTAAKRRARELGDPMTFMAKAEENFVNSAALASLMRDSSVVTIDVRYNQYLPTFSYYQVDDDIDIGFFLPGTDASNGERLSFRGNEKAGNLIKDVFQKKWNDTEATRPIAQLDLEMFRGDER